MVEGQREKERVLSGSEFSKGLLLVVVWCQDNVNGSLISFKRPKSLIERQTGCFIYDPMSWKPRGGKQVTSSNSGWRRDLFFHFKGINLQLHLICSVESFNLLM